MTRTNTLPKWAMESTDPYVVRLRQACHLDGFGHVRNWFLEMLNANAYQHAQVKDTAGKASDDGLLDRCMEVYAEHAAASQQPAPALEEIAAAVGDWQPGPEDIVLAMQLKGKEELASELETEDYQRPFELGPNPVEVDLSLNVIGELRKHMGLDGGEPEASLGSVLATIKARWQWEPYETAKSTIVDYGFTDNQRRYLARLLAPDQVWHGKRWSKDENRKIPSTFTRINRIHRRANDATMQLEIEHALDKWEIREAGLDDQAHPAAEPEPQVEVSLDNQRRLLDWIASNVGVESDNAGWTGNGSHKPKTASNKPWLRRPAYIHVLSYALSNGARTPREAHNRAYVADTARFPDRILEATPDGFRVVVNRKTGQDSTLSYGDARVAWPYYTSAVKERLRTLYSAR